MKNAKSKVLITSAIPIYSTIDDFEKAIRIAKQSLLSKKKAV